MKIYFAGPLFTEAERNWIALTKRRMEDLAGERGCEVTILWPYEFISQEEIVSLGAAARHEIFHRCRTHLDRADHLVALLDGTQVDDGTAWEIGYFYRGKSDRSCILGVRTDFRRAGETRDSVVNAMIECVCSAVVHSSEELLRLFCELLDSEGAIGIRPCDERDFESIYHIVNDAALAYRGVIPPDRWHEPYMSRAELQQEIANGVGFWGAVEYGELVGVMGLQDVRDVTLIRHAYVCSSRRRQGIGGRLLEALREQSPRPTLVGTWADAAWAVSFYEKHGFKRVTEEEKNRLLHTYWSVPERQIQTSVVLADRRWFDSLGASISCE